MEKMTKREKVMLGVSIGVSVAAVGVAGYFGIKYIKTNQQLMGVVAQNEYLNMVTQTLDREVVTLMEAASEGVFEEAIGTVNNKINHRVDRKKYLSEALLKNPNDISLKSALEKVEFELTNLFKRKDKFTTAQALYVIKDVTEEEL